MAANRAQILITAVDQTKTAFGSIKRGLGGLKDAARSVGGVLAGLGAAVSVAGLGAMIKSAIDSADALDEMSQRVGIAAGSLSLLVRASELSGVAGASFEQGLRRLSTTMLGVATGSEEAAREFSALGVEIKNQDGTLRATDQVLIDLAERFQAMPDGAQKTALAMQLFGRAGADLIPFLNQGRDGIGQLTAEAKALGLQISGETAAQAGEFNDALAKLRLAAGSMGNQIITALLPAMNNLAGGMVESAKQGGALRSTIDGVVFVIKALALIAVSGGAALAILGEKIGATAAAGAAWLRWDRAGARAIMADLEANIARRRAELAAFRASLFDPLPIEAKTPGIRADPELLQRLTKPKTAKAAQDTTATQTALMQAQLDAEFTRLKDGLTRQQTALDAALEDRLISVRDFYAQKTAIERREVDAEIARVQSELASSQLVADTAGKSENDRLRAQAEVAKAQADLITLSNRRADVEQVNARKAAQAERELTDALAQTREELAQITGMDTDADRQATIARSYRDLRARLLAEADAQGVSLVDRLIDVKAAQANLSALEAQWRLVTERMRNAQEAIQTQQQAGLLTEAQARQQIVTLQQQSATEMERLLPAMQLAAQAIGPDAVIRVQAWGNELAATRLVVDEMAPLWSRIGESFGAALSGMISGAQTWRSAMSTLFQQVADAFLQQIVIQPFQQWIAMQARMLALKLGFIQQEQVADAAAGAATVAQQSAETATVVSMNAAKAGSGAAASQAAIPLIGPGLAIAAMVAMVAAVMALMKGVKFAAGGVVTGPGTSTSDSIPARLSAGEYIVRAAAVRQVGVAFLDSINGLSVGPRLRGGGLAFAAGGLVPEVRVPPAPPQVNQSVRIVNAIDPGVTHDHLQSPAGEKVIVNIIGRNARAIRAALQG